VDSQTTIQNHLQLQHTLQMGLKDARTDYSLTHEKDADFFEALTKVDLTKGTKIRFRRGDCNITLRCMRVGAEICEWEKVRV
jgi:hypothetical protein